jgi:hypothetical protein
MNETQQKTPTIKHDDLDLSTPEGQMIWNQRLMDFAQINVKRHRDKLYRLGLIDEQGNPTTDDLPLDMRLNSTTTTET